MSRRLLAVLAAATVLIPPAAVFAQTPPPPARREAIATAGPMDVTRRIVVGVDRPGEDVAGYMRIHNGSPVADELIGARCACATRIEFHQVRRSGGGASMDTDTTWPVSGQGDLDVRPGSALHLMLIGFDPAKAADGKVSLTLEFRDAGEVTADFKVVEDSRAAWAGFD